MPTSFGFTPLASCFSISTRVYLRRRELRRFEIEVGRRLRQELSRWRKPKRGEADHGHTPIDAKPLLSVAVAQIHAASFKPGWLARSSTKSAKSRRFARRYGLGHYAGRFAERPR